MSRPVSYGSVFNALAEPTRRAVLYSLRGKDRPALEIAGMVQASPSALSQHMAVLKSAGLVVQRKEGRQRIYRLQAQPLKEIADWVFSFEEFWDTKFAALERFLEEKP